jgi:hypothetical protein
MSEFKFEVTESLGVLRKEEGKPFTIEVKKVSWNGKPTKLDIRNWNTEKNIPLKGISLTDDEVKALIDILKKAGY